MRAQDTRECERARDDDDEPHAVDAVARPALVPLTFDGAAWAPYAGLAGLALCLLITAAECMLGAMT